MFVYNVSSCSFESHWSQLVFRYRVCLEQRVPWQPSNHRMEILSKCIFDMIKTHNNKMGYTKPCSHPFPFTLTQLPPFLTHSGRCMCCLSHPFPIRIQIFSHKSIHLLPFQSIFSPCILRVYVLYVPVCLCAFVFHVSMCLCNSFLCTYCLCLFLQMPLYVVIPQDY